jgi:aspartate aminotransferase
MSTTPELAKGFLSHRLRVIQPSPSIAANALVAELRASGRDIVNFTIGEPDSDTPPHIVAAAVAALEQGDTHYTPTPGTLALREAIVQKLARDNGVDYALNEVVAGCGGKHIIFHALAATLNPGDEVLIPAPYWVSYPDMVRLNDGVPVIVASEWSNGFKLSPTALAAAITPRSKWLILNSPNNPTGAVYSRGELEALAEVIRAHPNLHVLSDEIYEHFVFDGAEHISIAAAAHDLRSRIFIVNGVSKGYAMTGWRLGFGAGPAELVSAICKLLSQSTTCPASISQAAAAVAFGGDQSAIAEMRELYSERRRLMTDLLRQAEGIRCRAPEGAFYIFAQVSEVLGKRSSDGTIIATEEDFVTYLIAQAGVGVVGGAAYGVSPFIRLSFATAPHLIEEGCRRIIRACAELQ